MLKSQSNDSIARQSHLVENVSFADELVKEYLLFRGFTQSYKTFNLEKKHDKTRGFQAIKVVELLLHHIHTFNLASVLELWSYLNENYFQRSSDTKDLLSITNRLELSLKRYYVINCINKANIDKVKEFFQTCGEELSLNPEWTEWFSLPYMKSPQSNPYFKDFFSRVWLENFQLSLTNFLSTTFHSVPLPKILNFQSERSYRKMLEEEITQLQQEISRLKQDKKKFKNQLKSYNSTPTGSIGRSKTPEEASRRPTISHFANAIFTGLGKNNSMDSPSRDSVIIKEEEKTASFVPDINSRHFYDTVQEIYSGHSSPITKCKFSPTGMDLASASVDGTVRIWSLSGGNSKRQSTLFCFSEILSLAWETKGNRMLFCGTQDGRVKVWNASAEKLLADIKIDSETPRVLDVQPSPTGTNFVVSAASNGHDKAYLSSWNMKTFQVEAKYPVDPNMVAINSVAHNHNASMIATGGSDGMVRIYDTSSCSAIMGWNAHEGEVLSVQFSYDETCVYSLGSDGKICKWSIHRIGEVVQSYEYNGYLKGTNRNSDLAFDSHGDYFIVGSRTNHALIYKTGIPQPIQVVGSGHSAPVTAVDWTHTQEDNTALVATGSYDHTVRITKLEKIIA